MTELPDEEYAALREAFQAFKPALKPAYTGEAFGVGWVAAKKFYEGRRTDGDSEPRVDADA